MRIVAVADTHLFHRELAVPDGDVFIHAGDLCRGGDLGELREAAAWIAELPHRHKIVVAGNHDWAFAPCARGLAFCRSCLARGEDCPGDPAAARALLGGSTTGRSTCRAASRSRRSGARSRRPSTC